MTTDDTRGRVAKACGDYLVAVNERMDGPFIPPTAISWLCVELADVAIEAVFADPEDPNG